MAEREAGLTFLFTDVEGSTRLLRDLGHTYGLLIRIHRRILQTACTERAGREMGNEGGAEFFGLAVHEVARICAAAHGGQVICSSAVVEGVEVPAPEIGFNDLGSYR